MSRPKKTEETETPATGAQIVDKLTEAETAVVIDGLRAELADALAAVATLTKERDIATAEALEVGAENARYAVQNHELVVALSAHTDEIERLHKAPPVAPAPKEDSVGTVSGGAAGLLVIGEPALLEAGWSNQTGGRRGFIVEVTGGEDAEMRKLAKGSGFPFEALPGGDGYRIDAVQKPSADKVADDIERWTKTYERPKVKAKVWSLMSTEYLARRACASSPLRAGAFGVDGRGSAFALAIASARVTTSIVDGKRVFHFYT